MLREPEQLQALVSRVQALEERVRSLERGVQASPGSVLPAAAQSEEAPSTADGFPLGSALTLGGRSLLVLGGAFLLRALTDSGVFSRPLGVGIGVAYALLWIGFSIRATRKGDMAGASIHGLIAAVVGYPLLMETITRFHLFNTGQGALALCAFLAVGAGVAASRGLPWMARSFVAGAMAAAWLLLHPEHAFLPSATVLLMIGLITVWLSNARAWRVMRWLAAFQIDAVVLVAGLVLVLPGTRAPEWAHLSTGTLRLLAGSLVAVYLGSFLIWTLVRRGNAGAFEVIQGLFVVSVGFGSIVATRGQTGPVLSLVALMCAAACYAVAFSFGDRSAARRINFYLYSWLALAFIVLGSLAVAGGIPLTVALCGLAVLSTGLGIRYRRSTLQYQGAVYLTVAALQGRVFELVVRVFFGGADAPWPGLSLGYLVVLAGALVCYVGLVSAQRALHLTWAQVTPRAVSGGWLVAGLGTGLVFTVARALSAAPPGADPALLAVLRTAVLAVSATALGLAGQRVRLREIAWLVIPLLVVGGIKLLMEDIRQGRPATLFVGFACYGIALMAASHMVRKRSAQAKQQPADL